MGTEPALTAVAVWTYAGERYEMAVAGLKRRIPEDKLKTLAQAFHAKRDAQLTDPALTDAEKFSHLLPHNAGDEFTWVVTDEVREKEMWGDSLQCWAASAANMLAASGWASLAEDTQTGRTFDDEDAVFFYLTECFLNDGDFQENGVKWFFAGKADEERTLREEAERKKLIEDAPEKYMKSLFALDVGKSACRTFSNMALAIKNGASMGISITFGSTGYHLIGSPGTVVNKENGLYKEALIYVFTEEEYQELPEHCWTYLADGSVIVLEEKGGAYFDGSGKEYPALSVKKDHLYRDENTGEYFLPQGEGSSGVYTLFRYITHTEDEVDLAHPEKQWLVGNGNHALTVSGYIRNLSKANDGMNGIRAMLIADSDNDANVWQITPDTTKKEDRPNTYKLCYTNKVEASNTVTIDLANYLEDGTACIAYACLLYPKAAGPVPKTGDSTPAGLYFALMLCAGAGLFLSRKKLIRP